MESIQKDYGNKINIERKDNMEFKDNDELKLDELENVLGGNLQGMGEEKAIENSHLFREEQIKKLEEEREKLLNIQGETLENNSKTR